jgi:tetratricopeptide (TPR) repeat protein
MAKIGRNDPCPCGSGKKYKKCCTAAPPGEAMLKRQDTLLRAVLGFMMDHPRCVDGTDGRFRCNDAFRHFVVELRKQHADVEIERFAEATRVPLDKLKAWLVADVGNSADAGVFDELSNSVVDLIDQNRLDEALAVCEKLQSEYPETIDGLERFAMVHEARGDWALAASYYRRALAFTDLPDQRDGFDDAVRADLRERLAHAKARAAAV